MTYFISTFYHFTPLENLEQIKAEFEARARLLNVQGLLVLGLEGINTTCACSDIEKLEKFKLWVSARLNTTHIAFKDSKCEQAPFRRYKVKIRDEIVTAGLPGVMPPQGKNHHLTPAEWNRVLKEESDYAVIDTRNWYEYNIGTFKGSLNPNIEKFTDFPEYIQKQGIEKDKKMLIFCTGGIRCEKGILELQNQGYKNVYQLEGGILNYLKEYPEDQYEGECFVFDHRVAVDQNLKASARYTLCPHCGQPADVEIDCKRCDHHEKICVSCVNEAFKKETCSKNCANQWRLRPGRKGARQLLTFELENLHQKHGLEAPVKEIRITRTKTTRINEMGHAETVIAPKLNG